MADAAFADRTVVVTGASRGIGEAIAVAFRDAGAIVANLDLMPASNPVEGVRFIKTDISSPESVAQSFAQLQSVDVLVNNAGIQRVGVVGSQPFDEWSSVIATNLSGAFLCCSAVIPGMQKRRRGAIVSIASGAAFVAVPGRAAYSAAKAGLIGFTRVMAVELAPYTVRANVVAPGFTATGLVNQALADGSMEERWMLDRVPLARLAQPSEIAAAVMYLAGDGASFVTGQTLIVDGGWTIQGIGDAPGWLMAGRKPAESKVGVEARD